MCELSETRFPTWENGGEEAKKQNKPKMGASERGKTDSADGGRASERAEEQKDRGKKVIKGQMKRKNSEREDGGVKKWEARPTVVHDQKRSGLSLTSRRGEKAWM